MASDQKIGPLAKYGAALLENGYAIIPIPKGRKGPILRGWEQIEATPKHVKQWAKNDYQQGNIGFLTRHTPAVDIDIYNPTIVQEMREFVEGLLGKTIWRVGQAPKVMLVYRTETPFRKVQAEFVDEKGQKHKVEILGDGQQFVGIGIHPDTRKAYRWESLERSPVGMPVDFLPTITQSQAEAIVAEFARVAKREGWTSRGGTHVSRAETTTRTDDMDENDRALMAFKAPLTEMSAEKMREVLKWVPDFATYEGWLEVGMALHHQFSGDEEGLELWDEWSQQSDDYDYDELVFKWNSFKDEMGRNIKTAATLLHKAREHKREHDKADFEQALAAVKACNDEVELMGSLATKLGQKLQHELHVDVLAQTIQERVKELTGKRVRTDVVRKAVMAGFRQSYDWQVLPSWCENVVYIEPEERFYLLNEKVALSERAFNARNDRYLLSAKDRSSMNASPDQHAAALALNVYQIQTVRGYVYLPGASKIIEYKGAPHINLFDENELAELPDELTKDDKRAIKAVELHFERMFPDKREREILLSFLSYTVSRLDRRVRWATVIYGAEGGGKTFIAEMMMAVLGVNNVSPVSARVLEDKFTGMFEGKKLLAFEETRIHGTSRYAVMDAIKPFITNDVIDIRRMHRDPYTIPNVTNVMLLTNHGDALPIGEESRRYFVATTLLRTKADRIKFNESFPTHFDDIYAAISKHPGAIRQWLETLPLHREFRPNGDAPMTTSRERMSEQAHGDESDSAEAIMEKAALDGEAFITGALLNVTQFRDYAANEGMLLPASYPKLSAMLTSMGFVYMGRARVEGVQSRFWSREPRFIEERGGLQAFVRAYCEFL